MLTSGCDLCLFDDIGQYEKMYIKKEMKVLDIIDELKRQEVDVTQYKFYRHMRDHVKGEVAVMMSENAPMLVNETMDKLGELIKMTETLINNIEGFQFSINADADPAKIRAYTGLMSEARHMIESIAKIQGEFKGSNAIKAKTVNIQYNNIAEHIMQDVCNVCKAKLAKTLEPLILKKDDDES